MSGEAVPSTQLPPGGRVDARRYRQGEGGAALNETRSVTGVLTAPLLRSSAARSRPNSSSIAHLRRSCLVCAGSVSVPRGRGRCRCAPSPLRRLCVGCVNASVVSRAAPERSWATAPARRRRAGGSGTPSAPTSFSAAIQSR
eukprot:41047-Chlamydomonas_euryale.AAC.3